VGGSFEVSQFASEQCGAGDYEFGASASLTSGEGFSIILP
jgi:hypothetical protein